MGILNATPDSFSDGTGVVNTDSLFHKAQRMVADDVDIIDIGGETTKPGADDTPVDVELTRVLPILKLIRQHYPALPISIDTRKAEVAEETLKAGANIINDVSGLQYNHEIASITAKHNASLVIMHSKETPKNMQNNPQYNSVVNEVYDFLHNKIYFARTKGVKHIIADVGIGFAKTTEHNITLLRNMEYFASLGVPLLLGISRKRFIGQIAGIDTPSDRDAATMLIHSLLLHNATIEIIRVHNVNMANQLRKFTNLLTK